jgi:hypothetical protein
MRKKLPSLPSLRGKADRLWRDVILRVAGGELAFPKCAVCEGPAEQVHHIYHKSMYGAVRWDLHNGIPICKKCHLLEKYRPAATVVAAIRYLGVANFMMLADRVEESAGRKVWTRRELELVISGLGEALVLQAGEKTK